jgi:hypothetical protein
MKKRTFFYLPCQHLIPILRTPNNVILAIPNRMRLLSESAHVLFLSRSLWGQRENRITMSSSPGLAFVSNHVQKTRFLNSSMKQRA